MMQLPEYGTHFHSVLQVCEFLFLLILFNFTFPWIISLEINYNVLLHLCFSLKDRDKYL